MNYVLILIRIKQQTIKFIKTNVVYDYYIIYTWESIQNKLILLTFFQLRTLFFKRLMNNIHCTYNNVLIVHNESKFELRFTTRREKTQLIVMNHT